MKTKVEELKDKIRVENERVVQNSPFGVGDCVLYKNPEHDDAKKELCRVLRVYGHDGELVIIVRNNRTRCIGWTSNEHYLSGERIGWIAKIDEPSLEIEQTNDKLYSLKKEREELTKEIDIKIEQARSVLSNLQKQCIHDWGDGYETGEVVKHFIGETEQKEFECSICGVIGHNT